MRIAIAEIGQETDTFSPLDTDLELFESHGLFIGDQIPGKIKSEGMFGAFLDVAKQQSEQAPRAISDHTRLGGCGRLDYR